MHIFRGKNLHLDLARLWSDAIFSGIPGDEPFLDRPFQGGVEHQVDAADRGGAEPFSLFLSNMDSTVF